MKLFEHPDFEQAILQATEHSVNFRMRRNPATMTRQGHFSEA